MDVPPFCHSVNLHWFRLRMHVKNEKFISNNSPCCRAGFKNTNKRTPCLNSQRIPHPISPFPDGGWRRTICEESYFIVMWFLRMNAPVFVYCARYVNLFRSSRVLFTPAPRNPTIPRPPFSLHPKKSSNLVSSMNVLVYRAKKKPKIASRAEFKILLPLEMIFYVCRRMIIL